MSSCSNRPTAAGSLRATSGRPPCRSTSPSSSSAPIRTSWNSARPTAERRHTARQRSTPDPLPCKLQLGYLGLEKQWLPGAYLGDAVLRGAYLAGAFLWGANLTETDLAGANLTGANFTNANLARANLEGANLARADLQGANLVRANLRDANLESANLLRADLEGVNLEGADLGSTDRVGC